jgi:hypothetical protein
VVGEREKPGAEGGAAAGAPAVARADDRKPHVLEDLVDVAAELRAEQPAHESVQPGLVARVEPLERLGVPAGEGGHQGVVALVRGVLIGAAHSG